MPFINDRLHDQAEAQRLAAVEDDLDPVAPPPEATVGRVDADGIQRWLTERIFGQSGAIDAIHRTMQIVQAGLSDSSRPLASHLFVGPTGTGKTEIVRQLAAVLRTGPDDFCRVDMSAMAQEHYAASFAGAPPGYTGSREGLSIFKRDQVEGDLSRPGIVLFDEVEKAHPTVIRALLHVLDQGVLHLANGQERLNFRNCVVFLTSNLGSREIRDLQQSKGRLWLRGHGAAWTDRLPVRTRDWAQRRLDGRLIEVTQAALERHFDPEFLNRVDEVTTFSEFTPRVARLVASRELTLLQRRAAQKQVNLHYSDDVVEHITRMGFDPAYGGRSVRREVRHTVWPVVARHVIAHQTRAMSTPVTPSDVWLRLSPPGRDGASHVIAGPNRTDT